MVVPLGRSLLRAGRLAAARRFMTQGVSGGEARPWPNFQPPGQTQARTVPGAASLSTATGAADAAPERPIKTGRSSWSFCAEIVGNANISGRGIRISAGEVLKLIDLSAAAAVWSFAGHPNCPTLAFDHVELLVPIMHGDLVHLDSRVAHVGNSSMVVQVVCRKKDLLTRRWIYTHEAFVTFVSLGPDHKAKQVPELDCETEEEEDLRQFVKDRIALAKQYDDEQLLLDQGKPVLGVTKDPVLDQTNRSHSEYVRMRDTTIYLRKNFLPRNLNGLGTVFGGDLLEWMDSAATSCAAQFTRNPHVITIAMNRVFFHRPILPSDLLELKATVVYCRRHTLQVEVEVVILTPPWETEAEPADRTKNTHKGRFLVLNLSDGGFKRPVGVGLDLDGDEDAKLRYAKAQHGFQFWASVRDQKKSFNKGIYGDGVCHSPWGLKEDG